MSSLQPTLQSQIQSLQLGAYAKLQQHWAKTSLQTSIDLFTSSDFSFGQKLHPLLIIGGVHGDEPEGVEMALQCLEWASQTQLPQPWILIPCWNVDGYARQQRTNANGVDLNRNFPASSWTSEHKAERYFPGKSPASENETKALVELILAETPRLIIHCHSWNPCIVYTGEPAKKAGEILSQCSGYTLQTEIGYPTPGSLSQFGWHDHQIPIICIEEQEHIDLKLVWPHFRAGFQKILLDANIATIPLRPK